MQLVSSSAVAEASLAAFGGSEQEGGKCVQMCLLAAAPH